ncbi:MAG: tetraacyldisaccharide 4'-kinase [Nitrospirota bacterium]
MLTPLSWIYGSAVQARLRWYGAGWGHVHHLGRPVISVGNLTVGGTGKTPLVIAIGEALLKRGVGVAVLSRGYGGRGERAGALVSDGRGTTFAWEESGDEPALMARRLPGAAVIVGANRVAAWRRFGDALRPGVVILDDGFQHLAIARDENVLLWDATDPIDRAALLPRGRLREPLAALSRATAVVITRVDQADPGAVAAVEREVRDQAGTLPVFRARFEPQSLVEVATGREQSPERLDGARVLAAAGVGRFDSFTHLVTRANARVVEAVRFSDHHPYLRSDLERLVARARDIGADMILTTEKDAVKLEQWATPQQGVWAVRIHAVIEPTGPWEAMLDRLAARVGRPA